MFKKTFYQVLANLIPDSFFKIRNLHTLSPIKYIYNTDKLYFIQIGANDGLLRDPLHYFIKKYHWEGILIEPVQQYFCKLKNTYKNEHGLIFENLAISDENTQKTIYKVKDGQKHIAKWYNGIASFNKKQIIAHKFAFPEIEKFIEKQFVKCITLQKLIDKHNVKKIDILCMDVEGHEVNIIKQISKLSIKPKVIIYEHKLLKSKEEQTCRIMLEKLGYKLSKDLFNINTIGFLK